MVIWGAIWGAVLGLFWPGHDSEFNVVCGLVLGVIAGLTLRRSVRKEAQAAANAALRKTAPPAGPQTAAPVAAPPVPATTGEPSAAPQLVPVQPSAAGAQIATTAAASTPTAEPLDIFTAFERGELPPGAGAASPVTPTGNEAAAPRAPAQPDLVTTAFNKARAWLFGGNTVVRMGVLVLFIGLAFLAKYAVENSLLPPELRLAAIGAAGIALFIAGFRFRARAPDKLAYAITLQGAGVAVLYLTVFAAFRLYQFLPAGAAFAALGLICAFSAVIAVLQNAQAMALIGFAGGFAAPILVSTGQGNHVGLFSYYMLLGVAIAGIAWARAWRALNVLGFLATFGIATLWGVLKYRPEDFASTEPFLLGFFAIYFLAGLLYALRHSLAAKQAVDATLVFGVPIVAFGLQAALVRDIEYAMAFSALALGAFYLFMGLWLARRAAGLREVNQWLAECFAALGLGFVTLAVPLALDGRWTSAVWAVEGAGVYWMGRRQARWLPRAAGLALQVMAAMLFLDALAADTLSLYPVANPRFIGAAMLAGAALAIAWWSREPMPGNGAGGLATAFNALETALSPVLLWVGFMWWQFALYGEISRTLVDADGISQPVLGAAAQMQLQMLAWVGSAFVLYRLALPPRPRPWPAAATPAWTVMPAMLFFALTGMATLDHVFQSGGWLAWPLAGLMHLLMLRRLDSGGPRAWWPWVHAGNVWLAVLLVGNALVLAISKALLWQTAWATVILLVAGTGVMLVLGSSWMFGSLTQARAWPLGRFARDYLWRAAAPLAVALALGALVVAMLSDGNARPLPYVPLLNPTDLAVGLALASCWLWLVRVRGSSLAVPAWVRGPAPLGVLAGISFIAINTVWLRVAHHLANVPWRADLLFESFLVQAGYSILWTVIALVLMVAAHRRAARAPWMLGAGLLGLTVLKLFVIDLSNRGGSERIIVFIAVGLLMLVVGYFAPLPPAKSGPVKAGPPQDGESQP
ncbi:MAG: DUF2339 domain-containing protein [Comamonadaceae bacterium]|nr:MAG: DUF2339 domain-containing protein [Comamonadaceae bacterium]